MYKCDEYLLVQQTTSESEEGSLEELYLELAMRYSQKVGARPPLSREFLKEEMEKVKALTNNIKGGAHGEYEETESESETIKELEESKRQFKQFKWDRSSKRKSLFTRKRKRDES